jgi:metallophosphoesterase superfamily enzyme
MKIDILSDLHFDYYFKQFNNSNIDVKNVYDKFFLQDGRTAGDVLVVAGDLGHYNNQNLILLKMIKKIYEYRAIVCVLGNHDYYLANRIARDDYKDSFERAKELIDLINSEDDLYCLDGDVVEIDGVRFGGAMGWYSDAYLKYKYPSGDFPLKSNNVMWKNCMPDFQMTEGLVNFDDLYHSELPKIEAVHKKCDVMITHINPSFKDEHMSKEFAGQQTNTFYCFNGHSLLRETTAKHWIFGHTRLFLL